MKKFLIIVLALVLIQCQPVSKKEVKSGNLGVIAQKAMVVSAREEASQIGVEIMQKGGNAFDAMVARITSYNVCYTKLLRTWATRHRFSVLPVGV